MTSRPPLLEVDAVDAGYGGAPMLQSVSLQVGHGESVAIIGANGAGKTTLVRTLCALLTPTAGRIRKDGVDITAVPAHRRAAAGIAAVLEGRHLFGELSVAQNLALAQAHGRRVGGQGARFSLEDVIQLFPFLRGRLATPVEVMSGGEQQMVAIARALLLQPDLLVMDEPSTGLAPMVVREIVGVIGTLRAQGMSLLLVEQNAALAAQATERAYVMSLGRIAHAIPAGEWGRVGEDDALLRAYLGG